MFDANLQDNLVRNWFEAVFGYANAANAVCAAMADQALTAWGGMVRAMTGTAEPEAQPTSWFRPAPSEPAPAMTALTAFMPWMMPQASLNRPSRPANPWQANMFTDPLGAMRSWLDLMPIPGSAPASWPMAYAMISAGVPKAAAYPAAEANIAAMNVARLAAQSVQNVFSTYRSDGGHAVAMVQRGFAPKAESVAVRAPAYDPMALLQSWAAIWR